MQELRCFVITPSTSEPARLIIDKRRGLVECPSECDDQNKALIHLNFDQVYNNIIRPAINRINDHNRKRRVKIECLRGKDLPQTGNIIFQVLERICTADITITDLTTHNPNVFLEYGIRLSVRDSLNILIAHEGVELPFNIKGLRCIYYGMNVEEANRARDRIFEFIQRFIEDSGPNVMEESSSFFKRFVDLHTGRQMERELIEVYDKTPKLMAAFAAILFTGKKDPALKHELFGVFDEIGRVLEKAPAGQERAIEFYELLTRIEGLSQERLAEFYYKLWELCDRDPDLAKQAQFYLQKMEELEG